VVLGLDDAVGCAALAWDVAVMGSQFEILLVPSRWSERDIQVDEFSLIVLHVCGKFECEVGDLEVSS